GWVEQQGPLPLQILRLQPGSDGPGLPVEFAVGQMDFLGFSVNKKCIAPVVRLALCPLAQEIDQRGRPGRRIQESVFGRHGESSSGDRTICSMKNGRKDSLEAASNTRRT